MSYDLPYMQYVDYKPDLVDGVIKTIKVVIELRTVFSLELKNTNFRFKTKGNQTSL